MSFHPPAFGSAFLLLVVAARLFAEEKPGTDVIVFVDDEKLIGELKGASDKEVHFHSAMGFDVHVGWDKVKELRSDKRFAAIPKDLIVRNSTDAGKVPQGTVELAGQKGKQSIEMKTASAVAAQSVPVAQVSSLVGETAFQDSLKQPSFLHGWKGGGTLGASFVSGTVNNRSLMSSVDMSRSDHTEGWRDVRNRTSMSFNSVYSLTTQGAFTSKFSMFHAEAVQDHFFKPRFFGFVGTVFDHNFSQGLDLVQAYGGGLGVEVIKTESTQFNARAGLGFMHQTYSSDPSLNRNIMGSRFGQDLTYKFKNGITFFENGGVRPAWTDMKYFFAGFTMSITVPVYKGWGFTLGGFDNFVNNPPPGFKRNDAQATMGLNYTFR